MKSGVTRSSQFFLTEVDVNVMPFRNSFLTSNSISLVSLSSSSSSSLVFHYFLCRQMIFYAYDMAEIDVFTEY